MLELYGHTQLWQWDTDQAVIVDGVSNSARVHFALTGAQEAYVVVPRASAGHTLADVPNILLQAGGEIRCFTYAHGETIEDMHITVKQRPKPSDYVYTPTEIESVETIRSWVNTLVGNISTEEASRVAAETARSTAEIARVNAEATRESTASSLNSASNIATTAANTAAANANTATTEANAATASANKAASSAAAATSASTAQTTACRTATAAAEKAVTPATPAHNGLMASADKAKLDSLENYSLPQATTKTLGGVKVGNGVSLTKDGTISVVPANLVSPHYDNVSGRYDNLAEYEYNRIDGKIYTVKMPKFAYSNTTDCIKADDNLGLICVPSTNAVQGRDDYANKHAFGCLPVNGGADDNGEPYVTAMSGDGRFSLNGSAGNVWIMAPVLYYRETEDANYYIRSISDYPHPGFTPQPGAKLPDGTIRPYMLYSKYAASKNDAGKMASISGRPHWTWHSDGGGDMSLFGQIKLSAQVGSGYGGFSFAQMWYMQMMLWIKYATKSSQTVMTGCANYDRQSTVKQPEANVSRVLLPKGEAQVYIPGSCVSIGEPNAKGRDRYYAELHSLAKNVVVKSITDVDADTCALNLDTPAFTTTATSVVSTMLWHAGATDSVLGNDGSPTNNLSYKEPYRIQGIETGIGAYETLGNVMVNATLESGVPHERTYVSYDAQGLTAAITDKWTLASDVEPAMTGGVWSYVKDMVMSTTAPGMYMPTSVGATSTTGHGDCIFANASDTQGLREWLAFGSLWYGPFCGLSCAALHVWVETAHWYYAGRLSALSRSTM